MKQSPDFLLRDVAGSLVLVPVGAATDRFPGMITLNETGKFLWDALGTEQTMESLVDLMLDQYQVEPEQARKDAEAFLKKLCAVGAVETENS